MCCLPYPQSTEKRSDQLQEKLWLNIRLHYPIYPTYIFQPPAQTFYPLCFLSCLISYFKGGRNRTCHILHRIKLHFVLQNLVWHKISSCDKPTPQIVTYKLLGYSSWHTTKTLNFNLLPRTCSLNLLHNIFVYVH